MKYIALLLLLSAGCARAADPQHFDGVCYVRAVHNPGDATPIVWTTRCHLDDMPDIAVYHNRFRIVLQGFATNFYMPRTADYVKAEVTQGCLVVTSLFWGQITMVPNEVEIRNRFTTPGFEIRPQHITLQPVAGGLEFLVDEPAEDFPGGVPSPRWQRDYVETFKRLGGAK